MRSWPRCIPRLLLLALTLAMATPARSASSFKSGNFGKTMTDAPVIQVVTHNLGEVPKALLIWSPRGTTVSYNFGIGFSDGVTQRSVSAASRNQRSFSETSSRQASKVITIAEWNGTVVAEADLIAWDSTTFTLNWTTNNGSTYAVHFLVIGGSDVSAKVLDWTMPAGGGLAGVSGAGFEPEVVFHAFARYSAATPHGLLGTGAMDGAGGQWANSFFSVDGLADTDTQRGQSTNACIYAVDSDLTVLREASFVSMDPDGFTVGFSAGPGWSQSAVSLALSGVSAKAGHFDKSSGASQSISGVGFQPSLVILSSFQQVAQFGPVPHARFGFGAGDGTLEGSSSLTDTDLLSQTDVGTRDSSSKVFLKADNLNGFTEAAADLSSFQADGFTLDWTTNDATATEILDLALGPLPAATISGTVFEDVNYGGGMGRDLATAADDAPSFAVGRDVVTVELYDAAGNLSSSTATAVGGGYSFTVAAGTYTVRVVNGTVTSSRPGSDGSELGVQTYRIDGVAEGAGDGVRKVGGELPSNEDAAANSGAQTLASLQGTDLDTDSITEWTQSIVTVDASGGSVTGVDFGFNFDTVVNTNDQDQGSLRQFVLNSNLLQ